MLESKACTPSTLTTPISAMTSSDAAALAWKGLCTLTLFAKSSRSSRSSKDGLNCTTMRA